MHNFFFVQFVLSFGIYLECLDVRQGQAKIESTKIMLHDYENGSWFGFIILCYGLNDWLVKQVDNLFCFGIIVCLYSSLRHQILI